MKSKSKQVQYPILLIITQVILSVFVLVMFSRIIYWIGNLAFDFEMSWYFINDIPYIGIILAVGLFGGFILEEHLSNLKK